MTISDFEPVTARTSWAHSSMVNSPGLPMLTGGVQWIGRGEDAVDEVGDVAEAAGLLAVAVDGEGFAAQGLHHEVGDDTAVVWLQAGAVGVEDADQVGVDAVVAMVGRDDGFRESLGLVVDGARADGIDAAPVGFDLGMDVGIAITLRGGGVEEAGVVFAREVEGIDGSGGADEQGLRAKAVVVDGAGG